MENKQSTQPSFDMEAFNRSITTLFDSFASVARQIVDLTVPAMKQFIDALYAKYLEAGAPYGETQAGMLRWMDELAQVRRMEMEIERIISQHQGLAYFRRKLAEKRESSEGQE